MTWKKTPNVANDETWNIINKHNKQYKIQWFFKETIPDFIETVKQQFNNLKWKLLHRFHPKHRYHICPTNLSPGYYDIPELMIQVNFKFLERFVEEEECFEMINWDSNDAHKCVASEIEDLYHWWKFERVKHEQIENELYNKLSYKSDESFLEHFGKNDENDSKIYNLINELELKWSNEDIYNLKRLISIKNFLWS